MQYYLERPNPPNVDVLAKPFIITRQTTECTIMQPISSLPIYAIQNQILSKIFLGCCSGHCPSSASSAALPVVISASAGWMKGDLLKIFQKPYKQKKIGMPM